ARNSANGDNDVDGLFSSLGSNLIGDNSGALTSFNAATGDYVGTAFKPLDPGLDPLGNYGGPTQTLRLKANSSDIDRGNNAATTGTMNIATDQRGQLRRSGLTVDIGAYEVQQPSLNKTYTLAQGTTLTTTLASGLLAGLNNPLNQIVTIRG